ncbi:MAG: hypothetical protein ACW98X_13170 [Promethearchaeota archaeon]|jgi:hypothetical protein
MKEVLSIPEYSIEIRFDDYEIQCYDLISNQIIDTKTYSKRIKTVLKKSFKSFLLLDEENKLIDEIYIDLVEEITKCDTNAGYIFELYIDKPNHGYYVGTYEIGDFYFSKDYYLIKKRSYPLTYCTRGCITSSKNFYVGLREKNPADNQDLHYLAKIDWNKADDNLIIWKKLVPSSIMAMSLIDNHLFLGMKNGMVQIWDIDKEECIDSINLFNSPISLLETGNDVIFVGSWAGEIAALSSNRGIIWQSELTQSRIEGILEDPKDPKLLIIVDKKGNFFQIEPATGKIVSKRVLNVQEASDPSFSSNLIFLRDWLVISSDASIWVFWSKDYSEIFCHLSDDPLIRKLWAEQTGFFSGDDDGVIRFWKIGFKIRSGPEEHIDVLRRKKEKEFREIVEKIQ